MTYFLGLALDLSMMVCAELTADNPKKPRAFLSDLGLRLMRLDGRLLKV